MAMLHDSAVRTSLEARLDNLAPDSTPRWGQMSVDQMLWHVNQALRSDLGLLEAAVVKPPLPGPLMKLLVLNVPWPKGAPTNPSFVATASYDFAAELAACHELVGRMASRTLDGPSSAHPAFGRLTPREASRLHAKHLNHHLSQFGV